jgi:acetate kinase
MCCDGLRFLGIRLDPVHNVTGEGDRAVSYDGEAVAVVVLATNEELIVARETEAVLACD